MLSSRSVCRACRAQGFEIAQRNTGHSRQFSSKISQTILTQRTRLQFAPSISSRSLISSSTLRGAPNGLPRAFGSQIRFNSSLNSGLQNAANGATDIAQSTADFVSDSANQLTQVATDMSRSPGYLRDMGLDFGWGFSTTMQYVLETIHSMNLTEWGGSIFLTTLLVRLCVFPLLREASDTSAKMQVIRPASQVLMDTMKAAAQRQDQMAIQGVRAKIKALYRANDIKLWKMALPFVQIPFGFGMWRVCRNMADAGVPGLESAGYLWFQNLTISDPYFILPMACALFQHLAMRLGGETGTQDIKTVKMRRALMYGLPLLTPVFIGFAPAAIQLTFASAAVLSLVTTTLLRNPTTRAMLKLTPFTSSSNVVATGPYQGTLTLANNVNVSSSNKSKIPAAAPSVKSVIDAVRPSNISKGITGFFENANEMIGDVMPQAQQKVKTRQEKAARAESDSYESRRRKEIDEQRFQYQQSHRGKKKF